MKSKKPVKVVVKIDRSFSEHLESIVQERIEDNFDEILKSWTLEINLWEPKKTGNPFRLDVSCGDLETITETTLEAAVESYLSNYCGDETSLKALEKELLKLAKRVRDYLDEATTP